MAHMPCGSYGQCLIPGYLGAEAVPYAGSSAPRLPRGKGGERLVGGRRPREGPCRLGSAGVDRTPVLVAGELPGFKGQEGCA